MAPAPQDIRCGAVEATDIRLRRRRETVVGPRETNETGRTYPLPDGVAKGRGARGRRESAASLVGAAPMSEGVHERNTTEGKEMGRPRGRVRLPRGGAPSWSVAGPSDARALVPRNIYPYLRPREPGSTREGANGPRPIATGVGTVPPEGHANGADPGTPSRVTLRPPFPLYAVSSCAEPGRAGWRRARRTASLPLPNEGLCDPICVVRDRAL